MYKSKKFKDILSLYLQLYQDLLCVLLETKFIIIIKMIVNIE